MDKFKQHAQLAQRLMDDIVDLEMEKIELIMEKIKADPQSEEVKGAEYHLWEKIKHKSSLGRRTGVGITAEGDMLAAMGLRYGTQEATDFSVEVHKALALNAYASSVQMAKERGAFEIFDAKREEHNPFILRLKDADPQLYDDMVKYGRRNIACLTIAPTGTTSLMTQTTSGIEPVFSVGARGIPTIPTCMWTLSTRWVTRLKSILFTTGSSSRGCRPTDLTPRSGTHRRRLMRW